MKLLYNLPTTQTTCGVSKRHSFDGKQLHGMERLCSGQDDAGYQSQSQEKATQLGDNKVLAQ